MPKEESALRRPDTETTEKRWQNLLPGNQWPFREDPPGVRHKILLNSKKQLLQVLIENFLTTNRSRQSHLLFYAHGWVDFFYLYQVVACVFL